MSNMQLLSAAVSYSVFESLINVSSLLHHCKRFLYSYYKPSQGHMMHSVTAVRPRYCM